MILAEYSMARSSQPQVFFGVTSDEIINDAFGLKDRHQLFGRVNWIMNGDAQALAEVVEILPPLSNSSQDYW
jgi:hypothetical protein